MGNLADAFWGGEGVKRDLAMAYAWLSLSEQYQPLALDTADKLSRLARLLSPNEHRRGKVNMERLRSLIRYNTAVTQ